MPKHSRRDMSLANDTRLADRNKRAPSTQDLAAGVADWCTINTVGSIGGDDESSLGQLYNAQSASFPHDPNKHGAGGPDKLDKSRMASDDSITASLQSAHDHGPTRAFDHLAIDQTMHVATLCRDLPPLIRLVQHSQVGNTNAVAGRTGPGHCESDCEAFQCMCRRILHAHDWTNLGRDPGALAYASPEKSQGIDDNEDPLECRGETCITFAAEQYRTERTAMVMRTLAGPDCPQQQGKVDTRSPSSGSHVGSRSHEKERREAPLASEYVAWLLFALVMVRCLQWSLGVCESELG